MLLSALNNTFGYGDGCGKQPKKVEEFALFLFVSSFSTELVLAYWNHFYMPDNEKSNSHIS